MHTGRIWNSFLAITGEPLKLLQDNISSLEKGVQEWINLIADRGEGSLLDLKLCTKTI